MCSLKKRPDNILKAGRRVVCVKAKAVFGRPAHVEGLNARRTNNVISFTSQAAQGSEKTPRATNRAFSVQLKQQILSLSCFGSFSEDLQYLCTKICWFIPKRLSEVKVFHTFVLNRFCFRIQIFQMGTQHYQYVYIYKKSRHWQIIIMSKFGFQMSILMILYSWCSH